MANNPEPVDFRIRVEGFKSLKDRDKSLEISYQINSSFKLRSMVYSLSSNIFDDESLLEVLGNVLQEFVNFRTNPELQIFEDENSETKIKSFENEPFIADPNDLKIFWESDRYVMRNQGMKVIEIFQNKKYLMIFKQRSKKIIISDQFLSNCLGLANQRRDLLKFISISSNDPLNFYVENEVLSEITISKSFNSFLKNLSPDKIDDAIVEVFIDNAYVEISLPSLLTGVLRKRIILVTKRIQI